MPGIPRISAASDPHIAAIQAEVEPGTWATYVRTAIIEKHERDRNRGELDELRTEIAGLRAEIERLKRPG